MFLNFWSISAIDQSNNFRFITQLLRRVHSGLISSVHRYLLRSQIFRISATGLFYDVRHANLHLGKYWGSYLWQVNRSIIFDKRCCLIIDTRRLYRIVILTWSYDSRWRWVVPPVLLYGDHCCNHIVVTGIE